MIKSLKENGLLILFLTLFTLFCFCLIYFYFSNSMTAGLIGLIIGCIVFIWFGLCVQKVK